jgi:PEP-CTERM motif
MKLAGTPASGIAPTLILDGSEGYYGVFAWNPDRAVLNAVFAVHATCCDIIYPDGPPTVTFARVGQAQLRAVQVAGARVPEPSPFWLLASGIAALVGWRTRWRTSY